MLISVVIPAFNEEQYIKNTMEKLHIAFKENETGEFSWETIVCDNNSTDKTAEIAANLGAMVVFEPVNQISKARNTGAGASKGEWLIFLDADSYPTSALLREVLNLIESQQYIGCGTTVQVEGGTLFNKLRMERLNPFFRLFKLSGGVFIVCQKDAFDAIDGFSDHLYAYEEFDFILRLRKYGRKRGKKFTILHKNAVITSGRKGEYKASSIITLIISNVAAIFLFLFQYILPGWLLKKAGTSLLKFWYGQRK